LTSGFQWAFWVCGAIGVAAIPITFLLVRSRDLSPAATVQPALSTESTKGRRLDMATNVARTALGCRWRRITA
jgi:hypothetical protein